MAVAQDAMSIASKKIRMADLALPIKTNETLIYVCFNKFKKAHRKREQDFVLINFAYYMRVFIVFRAQIGNTCVKNLTSEEVI